MTRLKPVSRLEDHLGFWLRRVSNEVSQGFSQRLEAKGVSIAEWVLLRAIYGTPNQAPSRLAEMMGMTKGGITKLADRLVARGLVLRRPDPEDARAQTLVLTASGERMVPELAAEADANDDAFFSILTNTERAALKRTLRKLSGKLGKHQFPID